METRTALLLIFLSVSSVSSQTSTDSQTMEPEHNCSGSENSYLWKIDVSPPVYLFGTMHVPYTRLWQFIPENVKTAFSSSEDVCLELELLDEDTRHRLSNCRLLPSNSKIEDLLSEGIISRISQYLDAIKEALPRWMHKSGGSFLLGGAQTSEHLFKTFVGDWKQLRPVWILYLLGSLTEERARLNQVPVVDTFLERGAESLGKGVEAVEDPEDQCRPFNKLPLQQVELALQVQLDYLETLIENSSFNGPQSTLEADINAYRCGDFSHRVNHTPLLPIPLMDNITITSPYLTEADLSMLRSAEASLYQQLVVKRNRKMTQQINGQLRSNRTKTIFFGLGAGHYLTEKNSIIDRLRRKGYVVQHIPAHLQINGSSLPDNFVERGDPSTKTGVLVIIKEEETQPPPPPPRNGALSDNTLKALFDKYLGVSQTSNAPPATPPSRQARSNIAVEAHLSRLTVTADTLAVEETSSSSATSHHGSGLYFVLTLLALASFLQIVYSSTCNGNHKWLYILAQFSSLQIFNDYIIFQ